MRSWASLLILAAACARDPLDVPCPDVAAGDLVLSEIRGPQGSQDLLGQWVEIYNASGSSVSLAGLSLAMRNLTGSAQAQILVRSDETIAAGGYVTLGKFAHGSEPSYITYGFASDLSSNFYSAAALELSACGELVDRVVYRTLPSSGSLGFDGSRVPDAAANDDERAWCGDASGDGKPGTPLMRNHPCVP